MGSDPLWLPSFALCLRYAKAWKMDKRYINKSLICSIYTILLISDFSPLLSTMPSSQRGEICERKNIFLIFLMHRESVNGNCVEWISSVCF